MKILAFDTVAGASSVAVLSDGELLGSDRRDMTRGHSEVLVPMIKELVSALSLGFQDLDLIAVTVGPGSFTGVRIGLATARSLSIVTKVPLVGISSFEAVAAALVEKDWNGKPVLIALETKRDDFYLQIFEDPDLQTSKPEAVASCDLTNYIHGLINLQKGLVIAGDGAERAAKVINKHSAYFDLRLASSLIGPDAKHVAHVAYKKYKFGISKVFTDPIYLRAPDVQSPNIKNQV